MIKDIIYSAIQFILLVLLQVFILDNVALWGFINPMVYIWFIILLPYGTPKWLTLLSSFLLGICVDIFAGDIGINAFACVFIAFLRPILLSSFSGNIDNPSQRPSISTQGFINFLFFTLSMTLVHHLLCFFISTFAWVEIIQVLLRSLMSSVITILVILLLDMIFFRKAE